MPGCNDAGVRYDHGSQNAGRSRQLAEAVDAVPAGDNARPRLVVEGSEEERLVLDDRPAQRKSRLLLVEPAKGLKFAFWQRNQPKQDAIEGELNSQGMRFAIVVARWNSFITERLLQGALDALRRTGCRNEDITVVRVPGSFEIPSQSRTLAETGKYDAIITLGCLIRGGTPHFDYLAAEVTKGVAQTGLSTGIPAIFGVLTTETIEQAVERAGTKAGNKGFEGAAAAIEMVDLLRQLPKGSA